MNIKEILICFKIVKKYKLIKNKFNNYNYFLYKNNN